MNAKITLAQQQDPMGDYQYVEQTHSSPYAGDTPGTHRITIQKNTMDQAAVRTTRNTILQQFLPVSTTHFHISLKMCYLTFIAPLPGNVVNTYCGDDLETRHDAAPVLWQRGCTKHDRAMNTILVDLLPSQLDTIGKNKKQQFLHHYVPTVSIRKLRPSSVQARTNIIKKPHNQHHHDCLICLQFSCSWKHHELASKYKSRRILVTY